MKKGTKEEVLERINFDIHVHRRDIKDVLDALEEQGYIKFKKEPKEYKVFVKIVTIGGEKKKFYYVSSYHCQKTLMKPSDLKLMKIKSVISLKL